MEEYKEWTTIHGMCPNFWSVMLGGHVYVCGKEATSSKEVI